MSSLSIDGVEIIGIVKFDGEGMVISFSELWLELLSMQVVDTGPIFWMEVHFAGLLFEAGQIAGLLFTKQAYYLLSPVVDFYIAACNVKNFVPRVCKAADIVQFFHEPNVIKNEKWKMKNEKWKKKKEKWKMKNEKWKMKNEKWKMKNHFFAQSEENKTEKDETVHHNTFFAFAFELHFFWCQKYYFLFRNW